MYNAFIRYLDTRSIYRHQGGINMFRKPTRKETGRTHPDHSPNPIFRKPGDTLEDAVRDARSRFPDAFLMDALHWR